jgi:hypothetical protein
MAFERIRSAKQNLDRYALPPAFGGIDTNFETHTDRDIDPLFMKAQEVLDGRTSFSYDDLQKAIALLVVGKD